jgi:hypothetical protein
MSKEDNIREILNEAAQEIVQVQNNPRSWLSWMVYLLKQLENQATMEGHASRESSGTARAQVAGTREYFFGPSRIPGLSFSPRWELYEFAFSESCCDRARNDALRDGMHP